MTGDTITYSLDESRTKIIVKIGKRTSGYIHREIAGGGYFYQEASGKKYRGTNFPTIAAVKASIEGRE